MEMPRSSRNEITVTNKKTVEEYTRNVEVKEEKKSRW
jgi:hypothetical protein